jgi:hypothetical protein
MSTVYPVENRSPLQREGQSPVESTDDSPKNETVGTKRRRDRLRTEGRPAAWGFLGHGRVENCSKVSGWPDS